MGYKSRDRIVVSTLRCGRSNPGSNPGHGINPEIFFTRLFSYISARINCKLITNGT